MSSNGLRLGLLLAIALAGLKIWRTGVLARILVRSRLFVLPFGDQGFLMPRRVLDWLGGFDEALASGADHALVWRAGQAGIPVRPPCAPIFTSAHRYATHGWARTTLQHLLSTGKQAIASSSAGASR